jgi:hypothetical protein
MENKELDVANIIEIQQIRKLLVNHPDLLSMFELLIVMSNNRLEQDGIVELEPELEENIEPELTDDDENLEV